MDADNNVTVVTKTEEFLSLACIYKTPHQSKLVSHPITVKWHVNSG